MREFSRRSRKFCNFGASNYWERLERGYLITVEVEAEKSFTNISVYSKYSW